MSNAHLPSLHWDADHQTWIPKYGFTTVEFPPELDPGMLPKPAYQIGERVRFSWHGSTPWEGDIRGVQIAGGEYDPYNESLEYAILRKYLRPNAMIYLVQARGHIRMVTTSKILGISTNTDRSPIWEHGYEEFDE